MKFIKRPKAKWLVNNVWIVAVLFLIVVVLMELQVNLNLKRELEKHNKNENISKPITPSPKS